MARSYGEGGYYETGGKWFAYVPLGKGKRKCVRAESEKDARQKWRALLKDREAGKDLKAKRQTVRDFMEQWQEQIVVPTVKVKTAHFYRKMAEWYIYPAIGDTYIDDLKPEQILTMLNSMRSTHSQQTIRHAYAVGKQAMGVALRWGRIITNPFAMVDAPRVSQSLITVLSLEQTRALLNEADGTRYATLFHLALTLGCRMGELLGIRACDLDMRKGVITINQQVQRIGNRIHIETPKTQSSVRELPVVEQLVDNLNDSCYGKSPDALLFSTDGGTAIHPRNLTRTYKVLLERAGIPKDRNFHLLRHTVATRMSEQGISDVVIGAVLGHSTKSGPVTWRYIHVAFEAKQKAVKAIADVVYK